MLVPMQQSDEVRALSHLVTTPVLALTLGAAVPRARATTALEQLYAVVCRSAAAKARRRRLRQVSRQKGLDDLRVLVVVFVPSRAPQRQSTRLARRTWREDGASRECARVTCQP